MLRKSLALVVMLAVPSLARAASVTLAWDPEAVDGFRIYYGLSTAYDGTEAVQGPSPITLPSSSLADPNNPSFELDGLTSCSHVYFALTAYNNDGDGGILESALSNLVDLTVVQKPLNVVASSSAPGTITISWDPLPSNDQGAIDSFNVHYGTSDDPDAGIPIDGSGANEGPSPVSFLASSLADPNAPSTSLTGLPAATYFLDVESECNDGASRHSPETSVVVVGGTGTTTSASSSSGSSGSESSSSAGSTGSSSSSASSSTSGTSSSSSSSSSSGGTHSSSSGSTHGASSSSSGSTSSTGVPGTTSGSSASSSSTGGSGAVSTSAGGQTVPKEIEGGCGCGTTGELAPLALLLAALAHARRRRLSSP